MIENDLNQKLSKTVSRLRKERQFKRDIINALHEGVIVLDKKKKLQVINAQAKDLLHFDEVNQTVEDIPLFKNRKSTRPFNLIKWAEDICKAGQKEIIEEPVWLNMPHLTMSPKPLLLSAKPLFDGDKSPQGLLLIIYDRSLQESADQQKRILETAFNSYDGQFITNEKGYIIHPNAAFSGYTSLMPEQLAKMTIIQWINQQVSLKNGVKIEDILKTLLETHKWSGEIELHPVEGMTFYCVLSLSMLTDTENNIEHYVGTLQDITDIKEVQAEVEHLAYYDDLTDLPNRRLITEHLESAILHHTRNHTHTALFYIDLDNFKEINEIHGHAVGDQVLIKTAQLLKNQIRSEDTLARINADEFVILTQYDTLNKESAIQNALVLSHKLNQLLEEDIQVSGITVPSAASIGVCIFPMTEKDTPTDLLSNADLAMNEAKRQGKNQTYFYKTKLTEKILYRRKVELALKKANLDKEFFLAYQPQISTQNDELSAEVLIRWINPELGFVPPDQFIHIAEDNKFILKLGEWITRTAFKQLKQWHQKYQTNLHISINISPVQFREAHFVEQIRQWQLEEDVLSEWITLELTEGILIENIENALSKIQQLTDLGYKISIDDFGTGYSSLSYFQKLPIHELKIDQSFVNKLPGSEEDKAIVNTIIQLANTKKLIIVSEGVETDPQLQFFKDQKTPILIQGYYYSKPLKADEFEEKYLHPPKKPNKAK